MKKLLIIFLFITSVASGQEYILTSNGPFVTAGIPLVFTGGNGAFSFTLASHASTSAGVYKKDSVQVRTLWSNVTYAAGTHTEYWDGKDDKGNIIALPDSEYVIKVQSNNVTVQWQGATIGNSSDNLTGSSKHRGYYFCMTGMAFTTTHGYFSRGYSEGSPSIGKFDINTPNTVIPLFTTTTQTGDNNFVATDDTLVYWGAYDSNSGNNTFVWAMRTSDDDTAVLANSVNYKGVYHRLYPTIGYKNQTNSFISGLAVQKTGSLLFIARAGQDEIQVINKRTGALIATVTLDSARALAVDQNNKLWAVTSTNTVNRYSVNTTTGALTFELTLSGLVNPLAIGANGSLVGVADGGVSQQVKFYNNSTGAATNTLGDPTGYQHAASVTNNKFFFGTRNFVAFQSDGSFWVNDFQNFRVQHYNSSRVFVNRIMSLGAVYSITADPNANNRVFVGCSPPNTPQNILEFDVDYVAGTSTLVKSWGGNLPSTFNLQYDIKFTTLSNGRTYGLIPRSPVAEIIELSASGDTARLTGITKTGMRLTPEGNLLSFQRGVLGGVSIMRSYPLSGFSGGNPTWSATPRVLFTTPTLTRDDPNAYPRTANSIMTASKKAFMFDPSAAWTVVKNKITDPKVGAHLIGIDSGTNNVLSRTQWGTHVNYLGAIPDAGRFDVGNLVNDYGGGGQSIIGNYILTSYHGEFWKNGQTNYYSMFMDNGLSIIHFGTDRSIVGHGNLAAAEMAGNALTPQLVIGANGKMYLIHGDESDGAGGHIWMFDSLNTIAQQSIVIKYPSNYAKPATNYTDLMDGLTFDATLIDSTAGWRRTTTTDLQVNKFTQTWKVNSSILKYDRQSTPDLYIEYAQPSATSTYKLTRDLGTNNVTSDWKVTLDVNMMMPGGVTNGINNNAFIEVLDDAGLVLTRFYTDRDLAAYPTISYRAYGNNAQLFSITSDSIVSTIQPLIILADGAQSSGNRITISYGGHTQSAAVIAGDWHKPTTLRIRFSSTGSALSNPLRIDIMDGKFYKDIL